MQVISVVSPKGGVGKSTTAVSISAYLAEHFPVLYIDLAHNNSGTSHFITNLDSVKGHTVRQCLLGQVEIRDCVVPFGQFGRLSVLASEPEMALIDIEMVGKPNWPFSLHEMLQDVLEDYDYVVLDTPGHVGVSLKSALIASDIVVIPSQMETWAAREVGVALQIVQESLKSQKYIGKQCRSVKILPTFWEENRTVKTEVFEALQAAYPGMVSPVKIHTSTIVSKTYAAALGKLPAGSRSYQEYSAFIEGVLHG